MPQHQHFRCRDGSNKTSSKGRVANGDLLRSASSDSDSTEISANTDEIIQQRPCRKSRADLEFRLSATYTRRHSSPGPRTASLQSPSGVNEAAILRRRKCQPHHRCASVNESVPSILKPPKYSPSSSFTSASGDSTAATIAATASTTVEEPSRFMRRWTWSEPSIGIGSDEGDDIPAASLHLPLLPQLPFEVPLNKSQKRPSRDKVDRWVADGVDFCSSVEVHVFHKWGVQGR